MAERKKKQVALITGKVVSNKMKNTVTLLRDNKQMDSKYHKILLQSTKFMAHDEGNKCGIGDIVRIAPAKPLSSQKRWKVVEIVEKAK